MMGGSPLLWSELAELLTFNTGLSLREAQKWVDVCRGLMTTQTAYESIPVWHATGVTRQTIVAALGKASV
jgi:hypothetical protein